MFSGKVFGIGFHKTATTSLGRAFALLGYRVTGPNGVHDMRISDNVYEMAYKLVKEFDAFQDNPWPIIYQELDRKFHGSKFILTRRPDSEWLASALRHFGEEPTPMRDWIYGVGAPKGNESIFLKRYQRHDSEVIEYFGGREDDLLVMNITEGDGWEQLCPFLDASIPNDEFPHANTIEDRE